MGRQIGELCYARRDGDSYSLDCPSGGADPGGLVLMQRSDFVVAHIELPRRAEENAREYLGYRVRGLYPAPAEETAFDFRLLRAGGTTQAVVFATRREVLDRYRALGRPLALPFSLFEASVPALLREGGAFVFVHPEWIEASLLPGRRWRPQARSLVLPRGGSLTVDVHAALEALGAADAPVRVLVPRGQAVAAREELAGAGGSCPLSVHEVGGNAARAALFAQEARRARPGFALRIQALLFLILVLATLAFVRSVSRDTAYLALLQGRLGHLRTQVLGAASDRKRFEALSQDLAALESRRPVDVYRLLSELSRVLGSEVRVASLIVDGRLFQVEAEGRAALELVARLREDPWFEGVRLLQIVPSATVAGQERFRLTGAYRAQ